MAHLTNAQLLTLKAAILNETDPVFVGYRSNGQTPLMRAFLNSPSTFVVFKSIETMANVGLVINYVAFEALTTGNLEKINTFSRLNSESFSPAKEDIRLFWGNVFSGALGGQGQATRDSLEALWRRFAKRGEKVFATGGGTTADPGLLVFEGDLTDADVTAAINLP